MSILIVGGTGRVGSVVARSLSMRGLRVSALLRGGNKHPGATQLLDTGVTVVEGDLRIPESLRAAAKGVETVFCSATSMPSAVDDGLQQVDHDGTLSLIEAAEIQGVKRFIYVSYSGNIRMDSPLERAKRDCENRLLNSSMEALVLRPSYFMEVWLSPMLGFDPANGSARIYGSGGSPVSYISSSNVADFAIALAMGRASEKNTVLELGGPEAHSQQDAVRIFEQNMGKAVRTEFVPVEALQAQYQSSDPLQRTFGALMLSYATGDVVPNAVETARRYRVELRSVSEYASRLVSRMSVA